MAFYREYEYLIPSRSVDDFLEIGRKKICIDLQLFFTTSSIKVLNWCADTNLSFFLFDQVQLNKFCRDPSNYSLRIQSFDDLDRDYDDLKVRIDRYYDNDLMTCCGCSCGCTCLIVKDYAN